MVILINDLQVRFKDVTKMFKAAAATLLEIHNFTR